MSKLSLDVTQVVEPDTLPELTPAQQQKLLHEIELYEDLQAEADENAELLAAQKQELNRLRAAFGAGAKTVSPADGFLLTLVTGESSSLDKKGLQKRFSITPTMWAEFVKKKPKKPFLKVTTPKVTAAEAARKSAPRDERDEDDRE